MSHTTPALLEAAEKALKMLEWNRNAAASAKWPDLYDDAEKSLRAAIEAEKKGTQS